jgi:hypothetical protein
LTSTRGLVEDAISSSWIGIGPQAPKKFEVGC